MVQKQHNRSGVKLLLNAWTWRNATIVHQSQRPCISVQLPNVRLNYILTTWFNRNSYTYTHKKKHSYIYTVAGYTKKVWMWYSSKAFARRTWWMTSAPCCCSWPDHRMCTGLPALLRWRSCSCCSLVQQSVLVASMLQRRMGRCLWGWIGRLSPQKLRRASAHGWFQLSHLKGMANSG